MKCSLWSVRVDHLILITVVGISVILTACGDERKKNSGSRSGFGANANCVFCGAGSANDYTKKVNDFDAANDRGEFNDLGFTPDDGPNNSGGDGNSPLGDDVFTERTPAAASVAGDNFTQHFNNLESIFDLVGAAGTVKMIVTTSATNAGGTDSFKRINTLIMDDEFGQNELRQVLNLGAIEEGYQYSNSDGDPEIFCTMMHIDLDSRQVVNQNPLPIEGLTQSADTLGDNDPRCPIKNHGINLAAGENGRIDLEIETEPLPEFEETRRTLKGLGTYGQFTQGPTNILMYEVKFTTTNISDSNDVWYIINTYYFILNVQDMTPSDQLKSFQYMGGFEGHEYYLILPNTGYNEIEVQAALLMAAVSGQKAYGLSLNSMAEHAFITGLESYPRNRVWVGLDDRSSEGNPKWQSGEPWDGAVSSIVDNFNNDGNEDCMHLNYGFGKLNDTECYKSYPVIIEVEPSETFTINPD